MICRQLVFREHALLRMAARRITRSDIEHILADGRVIAEYPTDKPFPSRLLLGTIQGRPLHVVAAQDETGCCFVITAYEPDPLIWNDDFTLKHPL